MVENGINIEKATSEDSEYTVVALSQKYKDCYLRTFPLDFHRMKDLLVVLHLQQATNFSEIRLERVTDQNILFQQ